MDIEKRARELLAAEFGPHGLNNLKGIRLDGVNAAEGAVQAIVAALTPPEGYVLVPAEKAADSERLDYLDRMNAALNAHHGTNYGWKLVSTNMVTRLMAGSVNRLDLNDANGGSDKLSSCRAAIDAARARIGG